MIYFDNAATSWPKPQTVIHAVNQSFQSFGGNPGRGGYPMAMKTAEMVYKTRKTASELFSMDKPENVVFTQNCTHALNLLLYGLLRKGDKVVISDLEHNSVVRPLMDMEKKGLVEVKVIETSLEDHHETVKRFAEAIDEKTKLVLCTHASNVAGVVLPIKEIGEHAHKCGVYFAVDGAQSAGMIPINMKEMNIDFLCVPGHKGLYGPSGTGMLLINCDVMIDPLLKGGTGSLSNQMNMPEFYPDRLESGTQNLSGICGLNAGMNFVRNKTIERLHLHEFYLKKEAYHCLSMCNGVILYTAKPEYLDTVPVLSFNLKGKTGEESSHLLAERGFALRGGLHCAPFAHKKMGTLEQGSARISFGAFNSVNEVYRFCETIKKLQYTV
ncbi:MAG: aminotransferase class V-fold PLP-dependent enzyme [Oscillospiraceae bacterium]|nr:aminotransferase class V-fold PLP-dependent enzyme [Oscillospiraceae bacterium]